MSVEISQTVAHLRRMAEERAARGVERQAALERMLPVAREILRARGATSVFVFGSVAHGRATANSDLDLATLGLPGEGYFDALGELMRALPSGVDLVRIEDAPMSLQERIRAEGREL